MGACSQTVVRGEDVLRPMMLKVNEIGAAPNELQSNGDNGMNGEQLLAEWRSLDTKRTLCMSAACETRQ